MKNLVYAATILFALAGSASPALTLASNQIAAKTTTKPSQPGPDTNSIPPNCPYNDPDGCGIFR